VNSANPLHATERHTDYTMYHSETEYGNGHSGHTLPINARMARRIGSANVNHA
jgi:hypothetical protein